MEALCESLGEEGFEVEGFDKPSTALTALSKSEFDVVLSDLMMPGTDGIQLLKQALEFDPNLVGVIMTGQGSIQTAVDAMKAGAFDYILKPFRIQQILPVLDRAMELRRLRLENIRLKRVIKELTFESPRYHIVGTSPVLKKVLQLVVKVAATDASVLIRGPSGTGKELIARAMHGNSPRRDKTLVTINCATLQEQLLESELFGHEKGSFTGADKAKAGLFEIADGGTLFIDEVAEMSPALQAKLLRVLEDGHYRRVGGTRECRANVRVVAATNKPLEEEQKAGRFREDLFFRLNVITVNLPPLRERPEDIPLLVQHFLQTRQLGRAPMNVDADAMAHLVRHTWPGNIRELANVIERAQILAEGNTITIDDLPDALLNFAPPSTAGVVDGPETLDVVERNHVVAVLAKHEGNKVSAAKTLGVSRRTLYRLIEKYGLSES
jgi:DNA-binding NtrC family response regulator